MTKRFVPLLAVLVAGLALAPTATFADNGSLAPTSTGETGLFTLFSGESLPQGQWSFGLYYNNWDRLAVEDSPLPLVPVAKDRDYDWNRLSASVGYGITDNFEISLMLPYEIYDDNGTKTGAARINGRYFVNDDIDADGLGNARLGMKWNAFTSDDKKSHFGLNAFIEAPTGDDDEGVATGDTGFGLGLAYDINNWFLNLGYRDPGDPDNVDVAEEILAGVGYAAKINDRFSWLTEIAATVYTGDDPTPEDDIDLTTGGRLWLGATRPGPSTSPCAPTSRSSTTPMSSAPWAASSG